MRRSVARRPPSPATTRTTTSTEPTGDGSAGPIRRRLRVRGRVQGVFYRDSVRRFAEASDVAGSALNCDDGSVEVVLEGDREAVEGLIAYCSDGPERAEVSGVEVSEEEPRGESGFSTG